MIKSHPPQKRVKLTFAIPEASPTRYTDGKVVIEDETGAELSEYTMDSGDWGRVAFDFFVDASSNMLNEGKDKGIRTVTMYLTDVDGLEVEQTERYYLINQSRLTPGENSLMTFSEALMLIPDLTDLQGWVGADDNMRIVALRESYDTLKRFVLNKNFVYRDISDFSSDDLNALSDRVLGDFQRAQVLHADYLLGGQPAKKMREEGVVSNSVGESTMFFRTTKPLSYGISDRAYMYISRYLDRSVRIQRG